MLHPIAFNPDLDCFVPTKEECYALWDKYEMLENIREHSIMVAKTALYLTKRGLDCGQAIPKNYVLAAALLHDIAKTYTIRHGGDHAQMGAAFVRAETGNPYLAHGVLSHIYWPWTEGSLCVEHDPWRMPLLISYADKRVCHDKIVGINDRFAELMNRYGTSEYKRQRIQENHDQSLTYENTLRKYPVNLDFSYEEINSIEL